MRFSRANKINKNKNVWILSAHRDHISGTNSHKCLLQPLLSVEYNLHNVHNLNICKPCTPPPHPNCFPLPLVAAWCLSHCSPGVWPAHSSACSVPAPLSVASATESAGPHSASVGNVMQSLNHDNSLFVKPFIFACLLFCEIPEYYIYIYTYIQICTIKWQQKINSTLQELNLLFWSIKIPYFLGSYGHLKWF